jgi:hypothetical protein
MCTSQKQLTNKGILITSDTTEQNIKRVAEDKKNTNTTATDPGISP